MARHLSEKYPSQSRAAKPAGKPQRNRAPASARPGPAKINRQLSQDGDTGYQAVIEELPLPAGYTGPTMTTSMSMQARTAPRTRTCPPTVPRARTRPLTPRTRHCTSPGLPAPPPPAPTTWQGATALLEHIKAHVAMEAPGTAVPKRVAMQISVRVRVTLTLPLPLSLPLPLTLTRCRCRYPYP